MPSFRPCVGSLTSLSPSQGLQAALAKAWAALVELYHSDVWARLQKVGLSNHKRHLMTTQKKGQEENVLIMMTHDTQCPWQVIASSPSSTGGGSGGGCAMRPREEVDGGGEGLAFGGDWAGDRPVPPSFPSSESWEDE